MLNYTKTNENRLGWHIEFTEPIREANFKEACKIAIELAEVECHLDGAIAINFVSQGIPIQVVETSNVETQFALWKRWIERSHEFAIRINGAPFVKGDPDSVKVLFFNLNGRNFEEQPANEYSQWLDYMAKEYETTLNSGDQVDMLNPEGEVLDTSAIGAAYAEKLTTAEQPKG